jgi:hypothetical protein
MCYRGIEGEEYVLMVLYNRLEKRRQAMLEMPQMIQTWKEVCCVTACNFYSLLTIYYSKGMGVDGRNGRNKLCFQRWPWYHTWKMQNMCTDIELVVDCMRRGVESVAL